MFSLPLFVGIDYHTQTIRFACPAASFASRTFLDAYFPIVLGAFAFVLSAIVLTGCAFTVFATFAFAIIVLLCESYPKSRVRGKISESQPFD